MYRDDYTQDKVIYGRRTDQGDWRYVVMSLEEDAQRTHYIDLDKWVDTQSCGPEAGRKRCRLGQVPGAIKHGRKWLVPEDATWEDNRKDGRSNRWR